MPYFPPIVENTENDRSIITTCTQDPLDLWASSMRLFILLMLSIVACLVAVMVNGTENCWSPDTDPDAYCLQWEKSKANWSALLLNMALIAGVAQIIWETAIAGRVCWLAVNADTKDALLQDPPADEEGGYGEEQGQVSQPPSPVIRREDKYFPVRGRPKAFHNSFRCCGLWPKHWFGAGLSGALFYLLDHLARNCLWLGMGDGVVSGANCVVANVTRNCASEDINCQEAQDFANDVVGLGGVFAGLFAVIFASMAVGGLLESVKEYKNPTLRDEFWCRPTCCKSKSQTLAIGHG